MHVAGGRALPLFACCCISSHSKLWKNGCVDVLQDKTLYTGHVRGGTHVYNPDGSVAFQTRDAVLTIKNKEVVYDALNQPIACLHSKTLSMVRGSLCSDIILGHDACRKLLAVPRMPPSLNS